MAHNFPQPLSEQEQNQLLNLYYETRDEDVRQKLLEHNLRLCVKVTMDLCSIHSLYNMIDQIFSLCYDELSSSLDKFDPNQKISFSSFAYSNMKFQMMNFLENENFRAYPIIDSELGFTTRSGNEDSTDVFDFLKDEDESAMPQNVASDLFVEDITNLINNAKWSEQRRNIVKMYLGVEFPRAYSKTEIANQLNVSRQRISQLLDDSLTLVQNYIAKNYPLSFPDAKPPKALKFESVEERNLYIFESYYGLNGRAQKKFEQICKEVCLGQTFVKKIVYEYKVSYEQEHNTTLSHTRIAPETYYAEHKDEIFNDYYGLNGGNPLSAHELIAKYNLNMSSVVLRATLWQMTQDAIADKKYSADEIAKIKHERSLKQKNQKLDKLKYVYCSYYGLDGYISKRKSELAQEFGVGKSTIESWLAKYKKILEKNEEDLSIISEPS